MKHKNKKPAIIKLLIMNFLIIFVSNTFANPNFTVGSNPYLTIHAYPHDLLKWPEQGAVFYMNPQTLPWQGDVTDINNRPNESYTNNYQNIEFAPPSDYKGSPEDIHSWMKVSSYAYNNRYTIGGLTTTKFGRFLVELGRTSINLELKAEGVGRAYEDNGGSYVYYLIPFNGKTEASRRNLDLKVTYAHRLFNKPFGFKIRYISKAANVPEGYIRFEKDGEVINTSHLTWGWATTGCNKIFGYSHINTDAFFQNSYSVFDGHQLDLQFSYEHNDKHKSGLRYRKSTEEGENYRWNYDEGSDFDGDYFIDERWKDSKESKFIRGYDKVKFWKFGNLDLGMLFFLQYNTYSNSQVNKLVDSDPQSQEKENGFIIETNPFVNYKTRGGFFDFGFLVELSRSGMRNSRTRWNSVSGADQTDVLWSTSPYSGWSPSWENFSKGSHWFFATGFEAYSSVNLYKRLAIQSRLLVLKKYTRETKIYGSSEIPDGGNSYDFFQSHERNNSKNETWMTGSIGFSYGFGPVQTLVSFDLPLAYLIKQKTKLSDNEEQLFEHAKQRMWQVQQPMTFRVLLVYAFGGHGGKPAGHPRM